MLSGEATNTNYIYIYIYVWKSSQRMNLRDVGSETSVDYRRWWSLSFKRNIRRLNYNYSLFVDLYLFLLHFIIFFWYRCANILDVYIYIYIYILIKKNRKSWRKLLKIIILNFILYIIQVYCTLIYKYEQNEKM
jgi:hypothetical protein